MPDKAIVFNIQTYCIHDGPGIRTTVFVKGCPLRCIWCQNPESQERTPEMMFFEHRCVGCGHCLTACPQGAIRLEGGIAVTDRSLCGKKTSCVQACPRKAHELVGKEMSAGEVFEQVRKDRPFYDQSGGGVTLSGGEPLFYPEFAESLFSRCRAQGIHTAIETCACADIQAIDRVFPNLRLAMIDIKHMDPEEHRRLTGVSNNMILRNIKYIVRHFPLSLIVRIPIVPGCNDTEENVRRTAQFLQEELGGGIPLQLLPYHRLGEAKSKGLGRNGYFTTHAPSSEKMELLKLAAESCGVQTQIGG